MSTMEITTDAGGIPLGQRIEKSLAFACEQGRIKEDALGHWRALAHVDYDNAMEALSKLPVSAPIAPSEEAYREFAAMTLPRWAQR